MQQTQALEYIPFEEISTERSVVRALAYARTAHDPRGRDDDDNDTYTRLILEHEQGIRQELKTGDLELSRTNGLHIHTRGGNWYTCMRCYGD